MTPSPRPALDDFQRRHRWIALPIAVVYKFVDDQGGYLAALITYYGFLSLFPMLLLAVATLGFLLPGNPHLQAAVLNSVLREFPLIGDQLSTNIHGYRGSGVGLVVGIVASVYGGLGVVQAAQNAMNTVWAVPRNERPNPIKSRLRSLAFLGVLGAGVLLSTAATAGATTARGYLETRGLGTFGAIVLALAAAAVNLALFLVAFRFLAARDVGWRAIAPGAVVAAVLWQLLQLVGAYYVAHELRGAQEVYGAFAVVLGLIAWIYLGAVVVVLAAELNVVTRRRLWPRALLTPFTDDVDLTDADERAYGSYAKAQQAKGFERVEVDFDGGRPASEQPAP